MNISEIKESLKLTEEDVKVGMSDIKNRWLHSIGKKTTFEHDCINEIISLNRFAQFHKIFSATYENGQKKVLTFPEYRQKINELINAIDDLEFPAASFTEFRMWKGEWESLKANWKKCLEE